MKIFNGFAGVIILLIGFSSCQKEIDWGLNNKTQSDSIYLKQYIELDTTFPSGLDTNFIDLYSYDAQKRLVMVKTYIGDNTTPGPPRSDSIITTLFYNGIDTMPYKILTYHTYNGLAPACDSTYLTYSNGLVSVDSTRDYNPLNGPPSYDIIVRRFNNNGNTTTESWSNLITQPPFPSYSCQNTLTYNKTLSNGNIIDQNATYNGNCSIGTGSFSEQFNYDAKTNPYYNVLNVHYPITQNGLDQKNNLTHYVGSYGLVVVSYVYSYNSNGLPVIVRAYDNDPQYDYKGLFFYTN